MTQPAALQADLGCAFNAFTEKNADSDDDDDRHYQCLLMTIYC